jgi:hypothetical protein
MRNYTRVKFTEKRYLLCECETEGQTRDGKIEKYDDYIKEVRFRMRP